MMRRISEVSKTVTKACELLTVEKVANHDRERWAERHGQSRNPLRGIVAPTPGPSAGGTKCTRGLASGANEQLTRQYS